MNTYPFKFFQKPRRIGGNYYLDFDMDISLVNVLRYIRHRNELIINNDVALTNVGVPIDNCWMRILTWRNFTSRRPERIEIDYRIIEINNMGRDFTVSIETEELLRLINHDWI